MSDFSSSAYFGKSFKPSFVTQMRKRTFGEGDKETVEKSPKTTSTNTTGNITPTQPLQDRQATPTSQLAPKPKARSTGATGLGNVTPTWQLQDRQATPTAPKPKTTSTGATGLGNVTSTRPLQDRQATPTASKPKARSTGTTELGNLTPTQPLQDKQAAIPISQLVLKPETISIDTIELSNLIPTQPLQEEQAIPISQLVSKPEITGTIGLSNLTPTQPLQDRQATPTSQLAPKPKARSTGTAGLGNLTPTQLSQDKQTTPTSPPVAKPRIKKLSIPSNSGSSRELLSSTPRPKPRPRSFNGEDSFALIEQPKPTPRNNKPVKQDSENQSRRKQVYSKDTKEYKAAQRVSQMSSDANPLEHSPCKTPPQNEKVAKRPAMLFPHMTPNYLHDSDPRSLIKILDLDIESASLRSQYIKNEEDSEDSDEETNKQIGELKDAVTKIRIEDDNSATLVSQLPRSSCTLMETTRGKSPPPVKPPRSSHRHQHKPPCSGVISISDLSTVLSSDPTLPITRSQTCSQLGTSPKPKSKWSPFGKRKNKNQPDGIPSDSSREPDSESVISETGTPNSTKFPLHKIKQPKKLHEVLLKNPFMDVNERDFSYNTPLHYILKKGRQERCGLIMALLQTGRVDVNALDGDENTPLHIAASKNFYRCTALLLAFNAKPFIKNRQSHFPIDLVDIRSPLHGLLDKQSEQPDNDPVTLSSLPEATAPVDPQELANERIGRLLKPDKVAGFMRKLDDGVKELERNDFDESYEAQPMSLKQLSVEEEDLQKCLMEQKFYLNVWKRTSGSRVLFLDGGGIRGLIQIEVLMELEKRTGRRITELFDWIIGTSTGGIMALGLVYGGKTLPQMRQLYFRIKNEVFDGAGLAGTFMNMPQKSRNLERILKRELGEGMLMSSVRHPRVMICTVNKAEIPLKVIFFNNFMMGSPELTEVPVWAAARATSAAPMYFTEFDKKYVDGGVKANNPCEFAMTQIIQYDQSMGLPARHFAMAVSIGTGIFPNRSLGDGKEFGMFNLKKQVKFLKELTELFTEAVGESEMTAEKFSVWCKHWRDPIPFFRFNPNLQNVVSPGEIDDEKLIDMILDTKQYLADLETKEKFKNLVKVFKRLQSDKT